MKTTLGTLFPRAFNDFSAGRSAGEQAVLSAKAPVSGPKKHVSVTWGASLGQLAGGAFESLVIPEEVIIQRPAPVEKSPRAGHALRATPAELSLLVHTLAAHSLVIVPTGNPSPGMEIVLQFRREINRELAANWNTKWTNPGEICEALLNGDDSQVYHYQLGTVQLQLKVTKDGKGFRLAFRNGSEEIPSVDLGTYRINESSAVSRLDSNKVVPSMKSDAILCVLNGVFKAHQRFLTAK